MHGVFLCLHSRTKMHNSYLCNFFISILMLQTYCPCDFTYDCAHFPPQADETRIFTGVRFLQILLEQKNLVNSTQPKVEENQSNKGRLFFTVKLDIIEVQKFKLVSFGESNWESGENYPCSGLHTLLLVLRCYRRMASSWSSINCCRVWLINGYLAWDCSF